MRSDSSEVLAEVSLKAPAPHLELEQFQVNESPSECELVFRAHEPGS
jgi:hypothetical protein